MLQQQIHSGQAVGNRGRALCPQQRLRQHGRAAGRADSAGAARRRDSFWNAPAFFLCHRIQRTRLEETFAGPPYSLPNPGLKPERVRAFEAGIQQNFLRGKYVFNATYFNNLFHDQINYETVDLVTSSANTSMSISRSRKARRSNCKPSSAARLLLNAAYTYTSTEILDNPAPADSAVQSGPAAAAPPQTLRHDLAVLSRQSLGREPERKFRRPPPGR